MTATRVRAAAVRVAVWFAVAAATDAATAAAWLFWSGTDRLVLGWALLSSLLVATLLGFGAAPIDRVVDRLSLGGGDPSAVHDLLRRLGRTLPVDEVLPRLAEATGRSLGRAQAEVEVLLAHGSRRAQVWPPDRPLGRPGWSVEVSHAGAPVGRLTVDLPDAEVDPVHRRLLEDLVGPAGIALATVRLTDDLRERREELARGTAALRRANERLLAARRDERDRLRAEVDRRVRRELRLALDGLGPAGGDVAAHVERALDELRGIARGIYPPRLDEAGLAVALEGWCGRRGLTVAVDIDAAADDVLRRRPDLRACLYFCVVTVLDAWSGTPAGASPVTSAPRRPVPRVAATVRAGTLLLGVSDPGHPGPAVPDLDSPALQACRDRVEAFDGDLAAAGTSADGDLGAVGTAADGDLGAVGTAADGDLAAAGTSADGDRHGEPAAPGGGLDPGDGAALEGIALVDRGILLRLPLPDGLR